MKPAAILLSAILISSNALAAQSAGYGVISNTLEQPVNGAYQATAPAARAGGGCPISLRAQHKSNWGLINAHDTAPVAPGQRIHLAAAGGEGAPAIVSISVTVRGTSPKARMLPVFPSGTGISDAAMSFDLRADEARAVSSDLLLRGFTSVQSVVLESVSYADGSIWTSSASRSCSIAPDEVMLVSR